MTKSDRKARILVN